MIIYIDRVFIFNLFIYLFIYLFFDEAKNYLCPVFYFPLISQKLIERDFEKKTNILNYSSIVHGWVITKS